MQGLRRRIMVAAIATTVAAAAAGVAAATGPAAAKGSVLFAKGSESFLVQNDSGQVPKFIVLNKTPAEKAAAMAIVTALNAQPELQPKIPIRDYIEVLIEKLHLTSAPKSSLLSVSMQISGHQVQFPGSVSRSDFLAGKTILLRYPSEQKKASLMDVTSAGHLRFRLLPAKSEIMIEEATGQVQYKSPILGDGSESIRFSGKGIREVP